MPYLLKILPQPKLPPCITPGIQLDQFGQLFLTLFKSALENVSTGSRVAPNATIVNPVRTLLERVYAKDSRFSPEAKVKTAIIITAKIMERMNQKNQSKVSAYYQQTFPTAYSKIESGLAITTLTDRQKHSFPFKGCSLHLQKIRESLRIMGDMLLEFGLILEKTSPDSDMIEDLRSGALRVTLIPEKPAQTIPSPHAHALMPKPSEKEPPKIIPAVPYRPPIAPRPVIKKPFLPLKVSSRHLETPKRTPKKADPIPQLSLLAQIAAGGITLKHIPQKSTKTDPQTPAMFRNIKELIQVQRLSTPRSQAGSDWDDSPQSSNAPTPLRPINKSPIRAKKSPPPRTFTPTPAKPTLRPRGTDKTMALKLAQIRAGVRDTIEPTPQKKRQKPPILHPKPTLLLSQNNH